MKTNIRKKRKVTLPDTVMFKNESGGLVHFVLPFAALYYNRACVRLSLQDKIDDTYDKLLECPYSLEN